MGRQAENNKQIQSRTNVMAYELYISPMYKAFFLFLFSSIGFAWLYYMYVLDESKELPIGASIHCNLFIFLYLDV